MKFHTPTYVLVLVVADPPFLADECLVKTSQTVRLLGKEDAKIIVCTGAVMAEMVCFVVV